MTLLICRDQRTGGEYTDQAAAADQAQYGSWVNEAADIEVEIGVADLYEGSGEADDPDSADVSGGACVANDIPRIDPITLQPTGEFVFRAGQIIELTDKESEQAHEQAIEEARAAAEPEYSPA